MAPFQFFPLRCQSLRKSTPGAHTSNMLRCVIQMGRVKRICVFEHSIMKHFNCACPAIQRGQGSGFLSEGSS